MIPVKTLVRAAPSVCRNVVQSRGITRTTHVVSVPPSVKISFAEKLAHGLLIAGGVCFIPIWILTHLSDYQAPKQ